MFFFFSSFSQIPRHPQTTLHFPTITFKPQSPPPFLHQSSPHSQPPSTLPPTTAHASVVCPAHVFPQAVLAGVMAHHTRRENSFLLYFASSRHHIISVLRRFKEPYGNISTFSLRKEEQLRNINVKERRRREC